MKGMRGREAGKQRDTDRQTDGCLDEYEGSRGCSDVATAELHRSPLEAGKGKGIVSLRASQRNMALLLDFELRISKINAVSYCG